MRVPARIGDSGYRPALQISVCELPCTSTISLPQHILLTGFGYAQGLLFAKRHAKGIQQGPGLPIRFGSGDNGHIEAAYLLNGIVVNLWENDMLCYSDRKSVV